MIERREFYIGGAWVSPAGTGSIDVIDPATESVIGRVPEGAETDVDRAVTAARRAAGAWAATPVEERAALCEGLAEALDPLIPELGALISSEVGTPLTLAARLQGPAMSMALRQYAGIARSYSWDSSVEGCLVVREPIGVVAAITPWNYPLALAAFKLAPALAAGCTVVLKPSELAPLSLFVVADHFEAVGFPPGVFNLITGYGTPVGETLVGHPEVDMVTFTGSTATGRQVGATAASSVKRVHLELGGKSAAILLPDADYQRAVATCLQQALMNNGQTCLAWTRMLVPADRHDEVVEIVRECVEKEYAVGDPREGALVGPVVSAAQQERIRSYIRSGLDEGAELVTGGPDAPEGLSGGYYVRPTVFANVDNSMAIAREEIFGPVVCVIPYRDEDEAVAIANDSIFGLHGAVFGADVDRATAVARRLKTGQVDVNGFRVNLMVPFGGYKQSGNGKELGVEGFEAFLETKVIQASARRSA